MYYLLIPTGASRKDYTVTACRPFLFTFYYASFVYGSMLFEVCLPIRQEKLDEAQADMYGLAAGEITAQVINRVKYEHGLGFNKIMFMDITFTEASSKNKEIKQLQLVG